VITVDFRAPFIGRFSLKGEGFVQMLTLQEPIFARILTFKMLLDVREQRF
jgi:hypothetical protein